MKKKIKRVKPQLEVVIINNHSEVVTKEVAQELARLRWMLNCIRSVLVGQDF